MSEELIYQIWKSKKILQHSFQTSENHCLEILHPGYRNPYSGPDFVEAILRMDGLEWHGSVEIHVNASDWLQHKHQENPAYENVILHVVWNEDVEILNQHNEQIPCLCLKKYIKNPAEYLHSKNTFICQSSIADVPESVKLEMKKRALKGRLQQKFSEIYTLWEACEKDWEETIYRLFFKSMGFHQNSEAMLRLASSIPLKLLWRYRSYPNRIEALLFGQAGLLNEFPEKKLVETLKKEYAFLKHKHQLEPLFLEKSNWKFYKLRPQNYPTIRLYELSQLLKNNLSLLTFLLEIQELKNLKIFFESYTNQQRKSFGEQTFKSIVINAIVPILMVYAKEKAEKKYLSKAEKWLYELPAEGHHLEKSFQEINLFAQHAADSQAFIFWKKNYCLKEQCSSCSIGKFIFLKSQHIDTK